MEVLLGVKVDLPRVRAREGDLSVVLTLGHETSRVERERDGSSDEMFFSWHSDPSSQLTLAMSYGSIRETRNIRLKNLVYEDRHSTHSFPSELGTIDLTFRLLTPISRSVTSLSVLSNSVSFLDYRLFDATTRAIVNKITELQHDYEMRGISTIPSISTFISNLEFLENDILTHVRFCDVWKKVVAGQIRIRDCLRSEDEEKVAFGKAIRESSGMEGGGSEVIVTVTVDALDEMIVRGKELAQCLQKLLVLVRKRKRVAVATASAADGSREHGVESSTTPRRDLPPPPVVKMLHQHRRGPSAYSSETLRSVKRSRDKDDSRVRMQTVRGISKAQMASMRKKQRDETMRGPPQLDMAGTARLLGAYDSTFKREQMEFAAATFKATQTAHFELLKDAREKYEERQRLMRTRSQIVFAGLDPTLRTEVEDLLAQIKGPVTGDDDDLIGIEVPDEMLARLSGIQVNWELLQASGASDGMRQHVQETKDYFEDNAAMFVLYHLILRIVNELYWVVVEETVPIGMEEFYEQEEQGEGESDSSRRVLRFDASAHQRLSKNESMLVSTWVRRLKLNEFHMRLIYLCALLGKCGVGATFGKEFLTYIRRKLHEFTSRFGKYNPPSSRRLAVIKGVEKLESLLLTELKHRVMEFRRFFLDDPSRVRPVLYCLVDVSTLHNRFLRGSDDPMVMKDLVAEWMVSTAQAEFDDVSQRWKKHFDISAKNLAAQIRHSAALIATCDELMNDVTSIRHNVKRHFRKVLGIDVVHLTSHEYAKKLFDEVVSFCTEVAIEQLERLREKQRQQFLNCEFSASLEMFRQFCPKFIDTMKFFEKHSEALHAHFRYYSIFYQLIVNTISEKTTKRLTSWVDKAKRLEDFVPVSATDDQMHSNWCKNVIEIILSPLETAYEIDFLVEEGKEMMAMSPPKSLVFVYFDHAFPLLVDYVDHVRGLIMERNVSVARDVGDALQKALHERRVCVNNLEEVLFQFVSLLKKDETAEALLDLSSGGEFTMEGLESPMEIPVVHRTFSSMSIIRNEVAVNFSSDLYRVHRERVATLVNARSASEAAATLEEMFVSLNQSFSTLADSFYMSFVAKVVEYLYVMFVNQIIRLLLQGKHRPHATVPDNIELFVSRMFELFSCDRKGVPNSILRHHRLRLQQIINLFKSDVNPMYLQRLYSRMRLQDIPTRDLNYYVHLVNLDDDDELLIHSENVLQVLEKMPFTAAKKFVAEERRRIGRDVHARRANLAASAPPNAVPRTSAAPSRRRGPFRRMQSFFRRLKKPRN